MTNDDHDHDRVARAYDLLVPEDGDTTYEEAARYLVSIDAQALAHEIASRTGAKPEGAKVLADALIWFVREYREATDELDEARKEKLEERLVEDGD
jgi:hypothetical protein